MCSNGEYLTSSAHSSETIMCVSKTANLEIKVVGNIIGKLSNGKDISLNNVLYVPDLMGSWFPSWKLKVQIKQLLPRMKKCLIKNKKLVLFWLTWFKWTKLSDFFSIYETVLTSNESYCEIRHVHCVIRVRKCWKIHSESPFILWCLWSVTIECMTNRTKEKR